jgi:hypothetical protein
MEQAETPPQEVWQPVVCRLCQHRFELLITCPEDAQITLCHACTLLVEWFGAAAKAAPTAEQAPVAPTTTPVQAAQDAPESPASQPAHTPKVPRKARPRRDLGGLLDDWGDLWRSTQEG